MEIKAFLTGGTGLVGSHLLCKLTGQGIPVRALKRKNSNLQWVKKTFSWYFPENEGLFDKIEWVDGDMLDIYSLEKAVESTNIIYHCAAIVSFDPRKKQELIRNNVEGTANLVNAALSKGVNRICHVSSNSALGKTADGSPVTEETRWTPSKRNTGYSISKFLSEAEIWRGVAEGLDAIVVMPSVIIGPGNWNNGSASFFPVVNKGLRFYTGGVTGYVDARDVADAIMIITREDNFNKAKNQKYLLNGDNLEFREFLGYTADVLHKPRPLIRADRFMIETAWRLSALWSLLTGKSQVLTKETAWVSNQKNYFDGSKITRMFDFSYHSIYDAIQNTADCYLNDFRKPSGMKNQ